MPASSSLFVVPTWLTLHILPKARCGSKCTLFRMNLELIKAIIDYYHRYKANVPRWIPRWRAWDAIDG